MILYSLHLDTGQNSGYNYDLPGLLIKETNSYGRTHTTLTLLKILALGNKQIEEGKVIPDDRVISRIRKRHE